MKIELNHIIIDPNDRYYVNIGYLEPATVPSIIAQKLQNTSELCFQGSEIYHAIFTCGIPSAMIDPIINVMRINEFLMKIFVFNQTFHVCIQNDGQGGLKNVLGLRNGNNVFIDESERKFLSYYAGMFFTKLVSDKLFGVDELVHVSMCGNNLTQFKSRKGIKIPDFIARIGNKYAVYESKGSASDRNNQLSKIRKANAQIRSVRSVDGLMPEYGVSCLTKIGKTSTKVWISYNRTNISQVGQLELKYLAEDYYKGVYRLIREMESDGEVQEDADGGRKIHIGLGKHARLIVRLTDNLSNRAMEGDMREEEIDLTLGREIQFGGDFASSMEATYTQNATVRDLYELFQETEIDREDGITLHAVLKNTALWMGSSGTFHQQVGKAFKANEKRLQEEYLQAHQNGRIRYVFSETKNGRGIYRKVKEGKKS